MQPRPQQQPQAVVDTAKAQAAEATEVLEAKAEEAPVDSAALAKAEEEKKAAEAEAQAKAEEEQKVAQETSGTAKSAVMDNPWEFIAVSAAFIASVLVIIFTGD